MLLQFFIKLFEQLYMEIIATSIATVLGISFGVLASYSPKIHTALSWVTKFIQTIPNFALLSLLLPIAGIGINTAIIVLIIYSMLPIASNTLAGITNISPRLIYTAKALGFSNRQCFFTIELPLAFPLIIAGIKTAAIISVGIATLASLAGAGGLGDFIFEGLELNNTFYILLGSIPTALMAIGLDSLIEKWESLLKKKRWDIKYFFIGISIASIVIFLFITSNFWLNKNTITVASKNYTEQVILGEIIAQKIESETPYKVIRKLNLGATAICHNALLTKKIDIYPEYTGTAYTLVLKKHYNKTTKENVFNIVKNEYENKYYVTWLKPFGFNNEYAVIVNKKFAQEYHLENISDLKLLAPHLILGVPHDIFKRPDGFELLKKIYHLQFNKIKLFNIDLLYQAMDKGEINTILGGKTDGRISNTNLKILKDDKFVFPPYEPAILVRKNITIKYPKLLGILNTLSNSIDAKTMQCLNNLVNNKKLTPYHVAHDFLTEHCCRIGNKCFNH